MKFWKMVSVQLLIAWILASAVQASNQYQPPGAKYHRDRVSLEDVKVITLYQSRQTTGRRSAPLPQLACQGGCGMWTPNIVQCYNMGSDGLDAAWKCEASMPEGYSFSSIEVGCEGYDYPEDPYILKDSCQLVYSLSIPRKDRQSYGEGTRPSWDGREPRWPRVAGEWNRDFGSRLVTWAVLGIIGYVLYSVFKDAIAPGRPRPPSGGTDSGGGGWGGGGGGGGGDNWRGSRPSDSSYMKSAPTAAPAPVAAGNGLMSALAAGGIGAALGYMMRPRQPRYAQAGFNTWNQGYGGGNYGGGNYGGGAGAYRRRSGGGGGNSMGLRAGYGATSRR